MRVATGSSEPSAIRWRCAIDFMLWRVFSFFFRSWPSAACLFVVARCCSLDLRCFSRWREIIMPLVGAEGFVAYVLAFCETEGEESAAATA